MQTLLRALFGHHQPRGLLDDLLKADDVLLLDVRTPPEFEAGHLPGAVNVPLDRLDAARAVIGATDRPVVAYCRSGARSGNATAQLERWGYARVANGGGAVDLAHHMGVDLVR